MIARGTRDVTGRIPRLVKPDDTTERDQRIALIAHDVKTPLSVITLETQLLATVLAIVPEARHSLERIARNVAFIDRLMANLLDLAAEDAGRLSLRRQRVDLARLLHETIDRAVPTVHRHRVQLGLGTSHHVYVDGDRDRLERVIANLLANALEYSTLQVTVTLEVVGAQARVTVIDRGRGLSGEEVGTVFERYRRHTAGTRGDGLGLYISRTIVEAHEGRIDVASVLGKGSEFFFELPTIA